MKTQRVLLALMLAFFTACGGGGGGSSSTPGGNGGGNPGGNGGGNGGGVSTNIEVEGISTSESSGKKIYYVKKDGVSSNDGSSWANATDLKTALSKSDADIIALAKGKYRLTKPDANFTISKSNLKIYGGFKDGASLSDKRNLKDNPTILWGQKSNYDDDVFAHQILIAKDVNNVVLDGLVIKQGKNKDKNGGGLQAIRSKIKLKNMLFEGNQAKEGGAIYMEKSDISIENCAFKSNQIHGNLTYGATIFVNYTSKLDVTNSVFEDSYASSQFGGAIHGSGGYSPTDGGAIVSVANSLFKDNRTYAIYNSNYKTSISVKDSNFTNNHGGIYMGVLVNPAKIDRCIFTGNGIYSVHIQETGKSVTISNSIFRKNKRESIYANRSNVVIINSTIVENEGRYGALELRYGSEAKIYNTVFWNNHAKRTYTEAVYPFKEIKIDRIENIFKGYEDPGGGSEVLSTATLKNSIVNKESVFSGKDDSNATLHSPNLTSDPKLSFKDDNTYTFGASSPAINGGTGQGATGALFDSTAKDILGNPRLKGTIDIGAIEKQ